MFTPLWVGATICIPDPDEFGRPGGLAKWMSEEGITFAHFTPAIMQLMTQTQSSDTADIQIPSLRCTLTVGDVLTRRDIARLRKIAPSVTCINLYGSTETQRAVGYYPITEETKAGGKRKESIPLGRGIEDVQVLVINSTGELAGIGELGEIYMRSPHLAKGYLNDEAQTRERFIVSPMTGSTEDRWYKTGDLGRYLADGNVEFAGRNDLQVKIRGYRIELGEIEATLQQYPGVRDVVVVAREDESGEKRLVAYLVTDSDQSLNTREIYSYLKHRLPEYMMPAAFVSIAAMPRKLELQLIWRFCVAELTS